MAASSFTCDECGRGFDKSVQLASHVANTHKIENKRKITNEELLEEIEQLSDKIGRTPTFRDMEDLGEFSPRSYQRRFGSWDAALKRAGFDTNTDGRKKSVSNEEMKEDLRRVHNEVDRAVTVSNYKEKGNYSERNIIRRFGSWCEAREAAGIGLEDDYWTGKNNAHWEEDYDQQAYSKPEWERKREKTLERDGRNCLICGMSGEEHRQKYEIGLHVHHIIPLRKFENESEGHKLENLATLCLPCHRKWEGIPLIPGGV